MRRRRLRRRLFWIGVALVVLLLALTGYVLRGVEAVASAARGTVRPGAVPTHGRMT